MPPLLNHPNIDEDEAQNSQFQLAFAPLSNFEYYNCAGVEHKPEQKNEARRNEEIPENSNIYISSEESEESEESEDSEEEEEEY